MTSGAMRRPTGVTAIAVILFIQAIAGVAGGIALIVERDNSWLLDQLDRKSNEIAGYGVAGIIWGVIVLFIGLGLWRGVNWLRYLVGIVEVASIASGVYLIVEKSAANAASGITQIAIAVVVLYLLFNHRASEFFTSD